ncbi:serine protease EDA2 [Pyrus ussuriensis x Pyrus communis]|uniref:Serine protease EDA2 n=1 Tax=Pyrus ussuriensis x Pyrus communis TaxID=2448454 RepID=A0A5N5HI89_9ROSA|nr:serine protease EDA2 [Pyrus ussuriensis x Pyrus communis]
MLWAPLSYGFSSSGSGSGKHLTKEELWFDQALDHFSPCDRRKFLQRYYEFLVYFGPSDRPIFLKICGESACGGISNDYLSVLAKRFGCFLLGSS